MVPIIKEMSGRPRAESWWGGDTRDSGGGGEELGLITTRQLTVLHDQLDAYHTINSLFKITITLHSTSTQC